MRLGVPVCVVLAGLALLALLPHPAQAVGERRHGAARRRETAARRGGAAVHAVDGDCTGAVRVTHAQGHPMYRYYEDCDAGTGVLAAWGVFYDNITHSGWAELGLRTSSEVPDLQQAFAAGYWEGAATRERIWQLWRVIQHDHDHNAVLEYLEKQDAFLRQRVEHVSYHSTSPEDQYWFNVALVVAQLDGLLAGYNEHSPPNERLTVRDLWLMNSDGDVMDIERAAAPGRMYKKVADMTAYELIELVEVHSHCSAAIKWTGDELLAAHTTWDEYSELLRIYKHYDFDLKHPSVRSRGSSHSSYPGMISSSDDFYVLDTGLVVIETTLNILNEKLYEMSDPSSNVLAWVRNLVSNRMVSTGREWTEVFSKHNSGTYNDQWLILDYKQFQPGLRELQPGTLWVLEQIPGFVASKDVSHILSADTFWASYNRPYFESINERSMYKHYTNVHGEMFSYRDCPRAKIFMRELAKVHGVEDMKRMMMHNEWQTDPFSQGCPGNAIAARFDLEAPNCHMSRVANGATDSKVTSHAMARHRRAVAIAGPTHQSQPVFTWDNPQFEQEIHEGQPTEWNFGWKPMKPFHIGMPRAH